jgi:hypothetical protein
MSGDPSEARLWADADVYVSFNLDAAVPATVDDDFDLGDWELVGLLDGDAGFVESRNQDKTDIYAWGQVLVRTSRRNYKETHTFTALEWNDTTKRLYRPGSTDTVWKVAKKPERVLVAFETREDDTVTRIITAYQAEIEVNGDVTRNETDLSKLPFIATIFPTDDGDLWTVQETASGS